MIIQTFTVAFLVSYVGSIPPGTINISVMQLSILKRHRAALFFALAASIVELGYAGLTVQFHLYLSMHPVVSGYFKGITALSLIVLGGWNLASKSDATAMASRPKLTGRHGFGRGLILGLLNPMTIPFWLVLTIHLENEGLIQVTGAHLWLYLSGLASGTFCLLITVDALGKKFTRISENTFWVQKLPGVTLLAMGGYFLLKMWWD